MTENGVLQVAAVAVRDLDGDTIDGMWRLYAGHYDHVTRASFDRDLAEKTLVFLGRDAGSGAVVGFSTALFYLHRYGRRSVGIYFSGDTIVHPRYWGQRALHRCVIATLLRWKLRHALTPLYWYLICSGYRTYLTLVRNFPDHWPRHDRATPSWEAGLIESLSLARYGAAWQRERGVISFGPGQPALTAAVAPVTSHVLALPEVRFFVRANPEYLAGDELAMVAHVNARMMLHQAAKWLRRALARWRGTRGARRTGELPHPVA